MMDAAKFLDLYEKAVKKAMRLEEIKPVKPISEYAKHINDLACIGRMRSALAQGAAE
jgi:hypothetical protein